MEVINDMATDGTVVVLAKAPMILNKLPPELRNRIWGYCFRDNVVDCSQDKYETPGLLLACKQTNKEVGGIYYSSTDFYDHDPNRLAKRLGALSEEHFKLIGYITIDITAAHDPILLWSLGSFGTKCFAFEAQAELFELTYVHGLPSTTATRIKHILYRSDDGAHIFTTSSPWLDYAEKAKAFLKVQMEKEPGMVVQIQRAVDEIDEQSSFFDCDHKDPLACWGDDALAERVKCNCPKKGTQADDGNGGEAGDGGNLAEGYEGDGSGKGAVEDAAGSNTVDMVTG